MIVCDETKHVFANIVKKVQWVESILKDVAPEFESSTMKPQYIQEFINAINGVEDAAEKLLLENEHEALMALETYIDGVHTQAIERTQTRYISSQAESERFLEEQKHDIKKYGFYKNGLGIIIVHSQHS